MFILSFPGHISTCFASLPFRGHILLLVMLFLQSFFIFTCGRCYCSLLSIARFCVLIGTSRSYLGILPSLPCPGYLRSLLLCYVSFSGHMLLILVLFVIAWSYSLGFCAVFSFHRYIFTFCVLCHSLVIFTCYVCPVPFSGQLQLFSKAELLLWIILFMFCVCHALLSVIAALWSPAGQRANRLALLCVMFSGCFCHFPMWCPGSGVMLDCFNS